MNEVAQDEMKHGQQRSEQQHNAILEEHESAHPKRDKKGGPRESQAKTKQHSSCVVQNWAGYARCVVVGCWVVGEIWVWRVWRHCWASTIRRLRLVQSPASAVRRRGLFC